MSARETSPGGAIRLWGQWSGTGGGRSSFTPAIFGTGYRDDHFGFLHVQSNAWREVEVDCTPEPLDKLRSRASASLERKLI